MKYTIDTTEGSLVEHGEGGEQAHALYSKEGFEQLSRLWVKVGWNQRYPYTFSWMGRPIIQLPEDMVRTQEVIHRVAPSLIIETGVAHGGSLVYYASLLRSFFGGGRVLGVDVEIRTENRRAIEQHEMAPMITLIEGDSVAPSIVAQVAEHVREEDRVLVILDSNHTKEHVARELERYHGFVTPGSYIVATDGIMKDLHDVPRGSPEWALDHPTAAAEEFAKQHPEFVLEQPEWPYNESELTENITHWPGAWLRRL